MLSSGSYSECALPVYDRSVPLQTEHIDNPKGYGEGEDARKYDARLRGVSTAQPYLFHRP